MTTAVIQPLNNTVNPVTYRIIGDKSSIDAVYTALILNCPIVNGTSTISPYSPNRTTLPQPEQVVQWYRASTFALTLDVYNNSAASYANMPSSPSIPALPLSDDTPLPSTLNRTFLECLNQTIGAAVPLINNDTSKHLTITEISEIATFAVFGLAILLFVLWSCLYCCCHWRKSIKTKPKSQKFRHTEKVREKAKVVLPILQGMKVKSVYTPNLSKLKYPPVAYGFYGYRPSSADTLR